MQTVLRRLGKNALSLANVAERPMPQLKNNAADSRAGQHI